MNLRDEIRDLDDLISSVVRDIKFYEEYSLELKKWGLYDLAGKPIEAYLNIYRTLLKQLKADKDNLIALKGNLTYALTNDSVYKEKLKAGFI